MAVAMVAWVRIHVPDAEYPVVVELRPGRRYVVGMDPLPEAEEEEGIVVVAPGVSRRHVSLMVEGDAVHVRDLNSKYHTFRAGTPVSSTRIIGNGDIIAIGKASLQITPPTGAARTESVGDPEITAPGLRRKLVALCRDHVVPPRGRGAWVLSAQDISDLLAVGGSPTARSITDDLARIKELAGIPGATTPQLIDWAIATGEITALDAVALDAYLAERFGGRTYDELILEIPRGQFLRRLLRRDLP